MHLPGFVRPGVELHIRQLHGLAVPQYGKVSPVLLGAHQLIDDIVGHEAAAAVHRNDLVPRLQAGLAAEGTVLHGIDHLAGQRGALGREQDQQHHEPQHKVHDRTGHHHQHPLPDRGLVQGDAGAFFRRHRGGCRFLPPVTGGFGLLALGAFLPFQRHIAAHRQGPQGVLGALADGFPEGRAHADGKLVDPDAAELCHRKVAELMDGDHGAEHEQRCKQRDKN